jgi:hypothetical protein
MGDGNYAGMLGSWRLGSKGALRPAESSTIKAESRTLNRIKSKGMHRVLKVLRI